MSRFFAEAPIDGFRALKDSFTELGETAFFESLFFLIATKMKSLTKLSICLRITPTRKLPALCSLTRLLCGHYFPPNPEARADCLADDDFGRGVGDLARHALRHWHEKRAARLQRGGPGYWVHARLRAVHGVHFRRPQQQHARCHLCTTWAGWWSLRTRGARTRPRRTTKRFLEGVLSKAWISMPAVSCENVICML